MSYHHIDIDTVYRNREFNYYNEIDWQIMLTDLNDVELAQCYEASMEGEGPVPLYLVTFEMQHRGLTFDELEGLLDHQYS